MTVSYQKRFLKDLASIPEKTRWKIEQTVFDTIPHFKSVNEIPVLEKMK